MRTLRISPLSPISPLISPWKGLILKGLCQKVKKVISVGKHGVPLKKITQHQNLKGKERNWNLISPFSPFGDKPRNPIIFKVIVQVKKGTKMKSTYLEAAV